MHDAHDQMFKLFFSTPEAWQDLIVNALPEEITGTLRLETVRDAAGEVFGGERARTPNRDHPRTENRAEEDGVAGSEAPAVPVGAHRIASPDPRHAAKHPRPPNMEPGLGRADLLLAVEDTRDATNLVYILTEHKSYRDDAVAVQLLRYSAGLWHRWGKLPLPVIHPVVFYHGPEEWTVPGDLAGLHNFTGRRRQHGPSGQAGPARNASDVIGRSLHGPSGQQVTIPSTPVPPGGYPTNLRYHLFDVSAIPDHDLLERSRERARVAFITFKYVMSRIGRDQVRRLVELTRPGAIPRELSERIWRYVYEYAVADSRQMILTEIDRSDYTETGGGMQTIADMLRDEGRVEAQRQMLTRLIDRRFGLTEDERALIASSHDADRLQAAADLVVDPEAGKHSILELLSDNGSP